MDRIGVPVELGESPQGLSPRVRLGVGVLLGIAAVLVNLGSFPLFRLSSPEFFFGGALVLVAFVGFGPAAGWTAAVIQVVGLIAGGWQGALIFLVVPGLIDWLRRRTGSLMLAVIVFWMTIGWVLAAFVYVYVLGFGWDFFRFIHLKDLINGVVDGVVAEGLLRLVPARWRLPAAPERLRWFAFSRLVTLVFPLIAVVALFYARAAFEREVSEALLAQSRRASAVAERLQQSVRGASAMDRLTDRVELLRERRAPAVTVDSLLDRTRAEAPELVNIGVTDRAGVVTAASPKTTAAGSPLVGIDLSDRAYFQETRKTLAAPYAPLILGTLQIRSRAIEPVLMLARPLVTAEGRFDGVVVGALDARALAPAVEPDSTRPSLVTVVDRDGRVIATGDTARWVGQSLADRYPAVYLGGRRAEWFSYRFPPATSKGARSKLFHVAFEPIPGYGWGLAAELSDDALYAAMGTTAQQINVGLAVVALLLSAVAALLARRVTDPLLALDRMAGEVAQGQSVPDSIARRLGGSAIVEVRSLTDRLLTMERALTARAREQEALFRRAFENQVVGVAHTDLDGRFTRVNDRFCEMVGRKRADLVGIPVRDVHGPGAGPAPEQIAELIAGATNVVVSEISAPRPGGRFVVTRTLTTVHRNPDGSAAFLVTEVEDITEQRALQAQLSESQKMESIGMLAGGVAHDFNNLLTPILGYTDMVLQSLPEGSDERDCLAHVTTAAERARDLTQQLLAFGRRQALVLEPIDVRRSITQIAALLRPLILENIAFNTVIAPDASSIRADQGQLQQILMNLGVNAVDSMPQGGVLTIEVHDVVLAGPTKDPYPELPAGRYVSMAVHDTGEGIPPESLPRIFEPFYTTKAKGKGTGLGLSTVYGIVTQHQGAIRAASTPGRGTTFTILFPALDATPRPDPDRAQSAVVPAPGLGTSVLVVEDEEVVRTLVVAVLRGAGYDVVQASSGEDAMALMAAPAKPVTALVTDVIMTGMDGRTLSDRLRADHPGLRTLFMTGHPGDVLDAPGLDPETTQILKKPFAPNELLAVLSHLLR